MSDKYINKTINDSGLQEIHNFLGKYHKKGFDHFTKDMLRAWAADAEFQLSEGNQPTIEIRSFDSVTGAATEYTISDDGINSEIGEI